MTTVFKSKKFIVSLTAVAAIFVLIMANKDIEVIKWAGGFFASIAGLFSLGQGIADGLSGGKTSAAT